MSTVCYPWTQVASEDGSFYYWNLITNETTWDPPQMQATKVSKPPNPRAEKKPLHKSDNVTIPSQSLFTSNPTPTKTTLPPNNSLNRSASSFFKPPTNNNNTISTPKPSSSSQSNGFDRPVNTRLRRSRSFTENTSTSWKIAPPKPAVSVEAPVAICAACNIPCTTKFCIMCGAAVASQSISQSPPKTQTSLKPSNPPVQSSTSQSSIPQRPARPGPPSKQATSTTSVPPNPTPARTPVSSAPVPTRAAPTPSRTQPPVSRPPAARPPPFSRPENARAPPREGTNFKPDKVLKVAGSHESISLPTTVVHIGNISSDTLMALGQDGTEKRGFLAKQSGFNWKDLWIVVSKGKLKMFLSQTDTVPYKFYDLKESTVELEKAVSRKYSIHVFITTPEKKHIVLAAANEDDYTAWMAAFTINGAADLDYIKQTQAQEEKKKLEERKQQERQLAKAEDEYVKSGKKVDVQEWKNKQQQVINNTDPTHCTCQFEFVGTKYVSETKYQHKVQVTFADQQWCIYRFEKQFSEAYSVLRTQVSLKTPFPKLKGDPKTNGSILELFLCSLAAERSLLYSHPKAGVCFSRLIAPIQYGDEKADNFVMPFKIEM